MSLYLRRFKSALILTLVAWVCVVPARASDPNTSADWLKASRDCSNDLCRFKAIQQALQLNPRSTDAILALGDYYLTREQFAAARERYNQVLALYATDWRALKHLADLDLRDGRTREAVMEYRKLEQEQNANIELDTDLAATYERLGYIADAQRLALSALRLNPRDQNAQSLALRLARRKRDPQALAVVNQIIATADPSAQKASEAEDHLVGDSASLHDAWMSDTLNVADSDASYLANVDATLNSRPAKLSTESDAVYLADVRIDRVGSTGLATSHVQQLILLTSDAGARRYSSRTIQYAPASESISVIHARLHKADGRTIEGEDGGDERVADRASAMFYDARSRTIRFASAEAGDVIELEYRIKPATNVNPYGNYFASMQVFRGNIPAKLKRYVVIADAGRKLYITGQSMPRLQTSEDANEKVYRWEGAELAALPNEPLGPPSTEISPYVHVSTLRDFDELGHWYSAMLSPQLTLSPELQQRAQQIAANYKDPLDRVRAVYRFVLTSTHYVALEFGIYSYKPYPVADVYARRFGDCKDKASLMVAMLRAVGVPADFVLVRTRPLGSVVPNAASIALFNHAIAYVPQFDLWLDGTADYYGLRELPLDDQGAMALTVDVNGNSQLRTIPVSRPADNRSSRTVQATIMPNGVIDFTGVSTPRGEDAPALRRDYEVQERQRESMRRGLADLFPTVKLDAVNVDDSDSDHPVQVRFAGTLDAFQGQHTLDLRTTWMQRDYLQRLALLSSRRNDVQLGSPWTTEEEFHFRLPAGAEIAQLPADTNLKTSFGTATIHYTLTNHELVIQSDVQFTRTRIETNEYQQFRTFCASLEQAFRREIKVVLR